jgi:MFS family permease
MNKSFRGWWMVAACFITFGLSTGIPYYNLVFFFDYFRDDHSWPVSFVTLGAPIAVLLTIWVGPTIVPRVSPRKLIVIGTGLTCLAFQGFAHLSGAEWEYYACWCLYMVGYFLSGPIPHQIIISNWFKKKRGRAMGIAYVGVGVFGGVPPLILPWLAKQMPYTQVLQLIGFLILLAWPLALFFLKNKPEDVGEFPDGEAPAVESTAPESDVAKAEPKVDSSAPITLGELSKRMAFWLLLIGSAASIGSIASVNFHMKFVFEYQGFTEQAQRDAVWGMAQSAILFASIAGRLLVGWLADKFSRKTVMVVTYFVVAAAIPSLFLVRPGHDIIVYIFAIIFGFAMGADYMLIPLMAADQFGLKSLARAMSAILPSDTIAQFWMPNLIARLRDFLVGNYTQAMLVVFGVAFVGAIAIGLLPRHPEEHTEPTGGGSPKPSVSH